MNNRDTKLIFENYANSQKTINESNPEEWKKWNKIPIEDLVKLICSNDRDKIEDLGEAVEETTYDQYKTHMMMKTPSPLQTLWRRSVVNVQKYSGIEVNGHAADQETFERTREDLYQLLYDMAAEPERPPMSESSGLGISTVGQLTDHLDTHFEEHEPIQFMINEQPVTLEYIEHEGLGEGTVQFIFKLPKPTGYFDSHR